MKKEPSFPFPFEEYIKEAETFHGFAAPGLLVGGFMVNKAIKHFPAGVLYEALCETSKCLPDAIQLLTPCTIGNGRFRIVSLGRFALSLFNKDTGSEVRVFPDPIKLDPWLELKAWYMKLKTKHEQDLNLLIPHIKQAEEAGLVHVTINRQEIDFLCNCCDCHCMILKTALAQPKPGLSLNSGFKPRHDSDLCTSCGTCIDRCPTQALAMDNEDKPELNLDRCIGCGVCASGCVFDAISLVERTGILEPPLDQKALREALKATQV
jgi:formylmethanofuran dehydrogenase subunit E/Pyruvate/2-oxoacid:ferredoxin oxidoreductase delta subunit